MIRKVTIKSGYAAELPNLKGRTFEFGPGLNIVYGVNASGKTSLLRIAAAHCFVPEDDGWSQVPRFYSTTKPSDKELMKRTTERAPGRCEAKVEWDGRPVGFFTFDSNKSQTMLGAAMNGMDDGSYDFGMAFGMGRPSAGEKTMMRMSKIIDPFIDGELPPPDRPATNPMGGKSRPAGPVAEGFNEMCERLAKKASKWSDGSSTLILDEPDMSLSPIVQFNFWTTIVPPVARRCQLIVISHSLASLSCGPHARYVELVPGVVEQTKKVISMINMGIEDKLDWPNAPELKKDPATKTIRKRKTGE